VIGRRARGVRVAFAALGARLGAPAADRGRIMLCPPLSPGRVTPYGLQAAFAPMIARWLIRPLDRTPTSKWKSSTPHHFMFTNIKHLYGKKLGASDGDIGHVKDFYFDDKTWLIRYLVAETGSWLAERQVLLSPRAFETNALRDSDENTHVLSVKLTRKQIEGSPSIDLHRPVSRQFEEEYHRYYGWPAYWPDGGMLGVAGFPVVTPPLAPEVPLHHGHNQRDDVHLRSTKAVTGYRIQATDGSIGSVRSFMVDGRTWAIRELVVETGHWYAGKKVLVLPLNIDRISYDDSTVFVNLTKEDIQQTSTNDVAQVVSNRE
jgi:hypothetical protein